MLSTDYSHIKGATIISYRNEMKRFKEKKRSYILPVNDEVEEVKNLLLRLGVILP